jgi:2-dehydro-3-deoxy-D-arabinonate dehydratase
MVSPPSLHHSPLTPGTATSLVCRFLTASGAPAKVGAAWGRDKIADLSAAGISSLTALLDSAEPAKIVAALAPLAPHLPLAEATLLAPVERQEVWAAGVTYLRSKTARMEESDFSATAYDRVYNADRPEIFFKSLAEKVVATGDAVGIRADATWNVPEPELALVINTRGAIVGCAIGNDMSSRDIEGENLLYLPQAKTYDRSCALGPWVALETDEATIRRWSIGIEIIRGGSTAFAGETRIDQIKRGLADLAGWLLRSQRSPCTNVPMAHTRVLPNHSLRAAIAEWRASAVASADTAEAAA